MAQTATNSTETVSKVRVKTVAGGEGYVYVLPAVKLSSKTRRLRKPGFDPIAAAESHLKRVSMEFSHWLGELEKQLHAAHIRFLQDAHNSDRFDDLRGCIHEIKGNAPILGCDAAGDLASPMATAMERCTDHKKVRATFDLVISAIGAALRGEISRNDDKLVELISMLDDLNARCELSVDRSTQPQAAGRAN